MVIETAVQQIFLLIRSVMVVVYHMIIVVDAYRKDTLRHGFLENAEHILTR